MSDNNDSNNSSSGSSDKKKIRRNKKTFYANERNFIIQQLISLMHLDNDNCVLLAQLQDNVELKNKLIEFSNDIKKFYRCSTWGYFVSINNGLEGDVITLLRSIFKDHGYTIFSKDIVAKYNGIKKRYTKLFYYL